MAPEKIENRDNIFSKLKKLFSNDVIIRNVGGKKLKVLDTEQTQYGADKNSLKDRFNRLRSSTYNLHNRDMAMSYQSARLELFRDYDCISGDTVIPLPDGTYPTISELALKYKDKSDVRFHVFSYDHDTDTLKLGNAFHPRSKGIQKTWKVTFDDDKHITSTSDHLFLCRNGEYKKTSELIVGESMMHWPGFKNEIVSTLNHKIKSIEYFGEIEVYDISVEHFNNFATDSVFVHNCMDMDPILSSALDVYSDECLTKNEMGKVLSITSDDEDIKEILENLFYDILNVEFNLWSWIRNMVKYGDFFLLLEISPEYGIHRVHPLSPYEVTRVEGFDPKNRSAVKFQHDGPGGGQEYENFEMCHMRLLGDSNFLPYGKSMLEGGRRVWKQLNLMEDSMLINRIMRAPEKRIFKIDVGNIPPAEVDGYMEKLISKMKKVPYLDERTGDYNLRFNLMNMVEDFYLPVRGSDSGTTIDTLPGMEFTGTEDIEYLRNKLMSALKIPKAFLGYDEAMGGKCIRGNVKINLIDGRTLTIKEIAEMFEYGDVKSKELEVYSYDKVTNSIIPGKVVLAKKTRLNAELVRVHLDNGTYLDTTPDHGFVLKGGDRIDAKDLKPGTSLQAVYRRNKKMSISSTEYEQVYQPSSNKWEFTRKMVDSHYNGKIESCGTDVNEVFDNFSKTYNHKVVSVELLTEREDTYNMEVWDINENHNYLVDNQIIIKNSTLAQEDVRFAKTIGRLQRIIVSELAKIAAIHLYVQGFEDASIANFKLELTNPSSILEQEKISIWSDKMDLAVKMSESKLMSNDWIYKNIFNLSEAEINRIQENVILDMKQLFRKNEIEEKGNDPVSSKQKIDTEGSPQDIGGEDASGLNEIQKKTKGRVIPDQTGIKDASDYPFGENPLGKSEEVGSRTDPIRHEFRGKFTTLSEKEDSKPRVALNKKELSRIKEKFKPKNRKLILESLVSNDSEIFSEIEPDGNSMLDEKNIIE